MKVVLLICSLVSLAWGQKGGGPCIQKGEHDFRKDPDDCTRFYRCANSVLHWLKCAPGTVYSPVETGCVHKGSTLDTCKSLVVVKKTPVCEGASDRRIPNTGNCAQYYDCEARSRWRWEKYLQECPYPRVFNTENLKCEHYSMVNCGNRKLPVGKCEYKAHSCPTAHCIPCYVYNPSCRDKPDGLNPYPGRDGSPFYIVCVNERLVYDGKCVTYAQYYDKKLKTCVARHP